MATKKPIRQVYTPEVCKLLTDMRIQSRRESPGALISAIYHYMFGEPSIARSIANYWFGLLESRIALFGDSETQPHPEKTIAKLLIFLSKAPAAPCLRSHQVGEEQHHLVYFMPFGCAKVGSPVRNVIQACNLTIPIAAADPRIINAFNIILMDPGAFTHSEEDPVYHYATLSCFSYTTDARQAMERYRAVFVATMIRTLIENIRSEIQHSSSSGGGGGASKNHWGQGEFTTTTTTTTSNIDSANSSDGAGGNGLQTPTYLQAKREAIIINRIQDAIKETKQSMPDGKCTSPWVALLDACFEHVVLNSRRALSRPDQSRVPPGSNLTPEEMQMFCHPYVLLPSDAKIKARFLTV